MSFAPATPPNSFVVLNHIDMKKILLIAAIVMMQQVTRAQQTKTKIDNSNRFSVMFGLSQPILLKGSNVAVTYTTRKWYFEYSHGMSLDIEKDGVGMTRAEKEDITSIHIPWSTGFGLGYRATRNLNVFWEVKMHQFEPTRNNGESFAYKTIEMGPAVSYRIFADRQKRFFAEPVVRYWFTTAVTGNEDFEGNSIKLSQNYQHKAHQFGLFANISIGMVIK
jgi:hypothetical protein